MAQNTGATAPGTIVNDTSYGTKAWLYPEYAKTDNGISASSGTGGGKTNRLKSNNFGFSIPIGAKINGIKFIIELNATSPYRVNFGICYAYKNDVIMSGYTIGGDASYEFPFSPTVVTVGGETSLWGTTWTAADINDSDFGISIQATLLDVGAVANVDYVTATVYYDNVVDPTNAYASDDTYADLTGATSGDLGVSISIDGGLNYSNILTKTFSSTEESLTYGTGLTELWGFALTGDDIDDTSFRLKISHNGISQIYKNFGFAITSSYILTGLEVAVEAKYISGDATIYIDNIEVKAYYGTSTLQIQAGSQAYASDGLKADTSPGVMVYYDGTKWVTFDTGLPVYTTIHSHSPSVSPSTSLSVSPPNSFSPSVSISISPSISTSISKSISTSSSISISPSRSSSISPSVSPS